VPVLDNPKHEAFAHGLASGLSADEAYGTAGYSPNRGNATRLKANESVAARVEEIRSAAADRADWIAARRLEMLRDVAYSNIRKDPRAAIAAIAEANKMQGSHAAIRHKIGGIQGEPIEVVHRIEREIIRPSSKAA